MISTPTSYPNLNVLLPKKASARMPASPVEIPKCSSMLSGVTIAPPSVTLLDPPLPLLASMGRRRRSTHSRARILISVVRQLFQKRRLRPPPSTPTGKCLPIFWTCMKPHKGHLPIRLFTQIRIINQTMSRPWRSKVLVCSAKGQYLVAHVCSIIDPKKTGSDLNGGFQEPTNILNSSYDAGVPTSQPFVVAPVTSSPAGRLSASSPILSAEPMRLRGTQTLVRATPSPPRARPQSSSSTFPTSATVGGTTAPLVPNAVPRTLEPAPGAVIARQDTDIIPETPQSDQDPQQAHERTLAVDPSLVHPAIGSQGSFLIHEPQAEMRQVPGPSSPRKRGAPDDFERPPTPTKKTRRMSNESQKPAGLRPMTTRVGAMRGRQEATSPAKARAPARKPSARISKAIVTPRTSMWDETIDDGFGRKAAETAAKMKKPTEPPV